MKPGESFIRQPIRGLQTMLRVIAKDDPSIPTVVPDGIYGPTTMAAVTEIQRQEGLPLTGITDIVTWERIYLRYDDAQIRVDRAEPIEIILEPGQVFVLGDESPYIYLAQSMLIWLSRDNPNMAPPDHSGIYDASTKNAVGEFQKIAGLTQTGNLDKITWKHLSRHFTLNAHHNSQKRSIETKNLE